MKRHVSKDTRVDPCGEGHRLPGTHRHCVGKLAAELSHVGDNRSEQKAYRGRTGTWELTSYVGSVAVHIGDVDHRPLPT